MSHEFHIFDSESAFLAEGVHLLATATREAIAERGRCALGLSGGSTPGPIYETFGQEEGIDWSKVWLFLADDRLIERNDPKSNQFLLRMTLLKHAPIPESQLIFPDPGLPHADCAALYDRMLKDLLAKGPADLVTLGLGEDGHIASLFPPVPKEADGPTFAIPTTTDRFAVRERISVTFPVLTAAKTKVFFLKGEAKRKTWADMVLRKDDEERWPGRRVIQSGGVKVLFLP